MRHFLPRLAFMLVCFAQASLAADMLPAIDWQGKSYPFRKMGSVELSDMAADAARGLSGSFGRVACAFTLGHAFTGSEKDRWRGAFEGIVTLGAPVLDTLVALSGYALRVVNPKDAFSPLPVAVPLKLLAEIDQITGDQAGALYKDYTFLLLVEERRISYAFGLGCEDVIFLNHIVPVGAKLDQQAVTDNFREQVLMMQRALSAMCKLSASKHPFCRLL